MQRFNSLGLLLYVSQYKGRDVLLAPHTSQNLTITSSRTTTKFDFNPGPWTSRCEYFLGKQLPNLRRCWIVDQWMIWHPRGFHYPPHFSTLMKWWMQNLGSIVRRWMGRWMGIGDAAGSWIYPCFHPQLSPPPTDWWDDEDSLAVWESFSSLFFIWCVQVCRRACQRVDPWALTTMLHYSSISGRSSRGKPRCGYRPFPSTERRRDPLPLSNSHWEDKRRRGRRKNETRWANTAAGSQQGTFYSFESPDVKGAHLFCRTS